jgi:glycosyltransferase involved in cell wall biosynthesis
MSSILLINWVNISRKQVYQIRAMIDNGHKVFVFTNDLLGDSSHWVDEIGQGVFYEKQPKKLIDRLLSLYRTVQKNKNIKCAILAPEGRYSIFALIFLRFLKIPIICIEWGSIGDMKNLSFATRYVMKYCYKNSNLIWYKEPFMKPLIEKITNKRLFFLPNAVESSVQPYRKFNERQTTFAWANRFIRGRHPEWYVKAANSISKSNVYHAILMGFFNDQINNKMQNQCINLASNNIILKPFGNAFELWSDCRYFVLAADHIFGNNSMLESMAHGAVPIVTQSFGLDQIISDGENGFVAENSEIGVALAMKKASKLDEQMWQSMSRNAIKTVNEKYTVKIWQVRFDKLLKTLEDELYAVKH